MPLRRSLLVAAATSVLLVLGVMAPTADGATAAPRATNLSVKVAGVPRGTTPHVVVTGPGHFRRTLTRSATFKHVKPGTYALRAASIVAHGSHAGRYYFRPDHAKITAASGKTTTVHARFSRTTLTVKPVALPSGAGARLTLTGPKHFHVSWTATKARRFVNVAPGSYRLSAKKVVVKKAKKNSPAGTYLPKVPKALSVRRGSTATLRADYTTVIAPRVTVPAKTAVKTTSVPAGAAPGTRGTIVLAGTHSVGDIVAIGQTAATPYGFYGRLTKRLGTASGGTNWAVTAVTLKTVLPRGEVSAPVSGDASLSSRTMGSESVKRMPGRVRPFNATADAFLKSVDCSGSNAKLQVSAAVAAHFSMNPDVNVWAAKLSISPRATLTGDFSASVSGSGTCTLPERDLTEPIFLNAVTVPAGPVPVTFVQTAEFSVEGEAVSQATVGVGVHAEIGAEGQASVDPSGFKTSGIRPIHTISGSTTVTANADAHVYLTAKFESKIAGVAGPYVTATVGPKLHANIAENPWWTVRAHASIAVGADVDALGLHLTTGDQQLWSDEPILLQASGGADSSGSSGSNQTGSTGAPALRRILTYTSGSDLGCDLQSKEDSNGEFFHDTACGSFAAIDGTLYAPGDTPAGSSLGARTTWTPISQTSTGTGSAADPTTVTTVAAAGDSGIRLTQTDKWAADGSTIAHTFKVTNTGTAAKVVRLSHGFDCYIGDSDTGTGELALAGQLVGCLRTIPSGELVTLRLQALTPGATVTEAQYDDVWSQVAAQTDLNNGCRCSDDIDNGAAVSWNVTVPAGSTVALQGETSMQRP